MIFKLINFVLIIGIFVYVFYRYIKGFIIRHIADRDQFIRLLKGAKKQLIEEQAVLLEEIEEQKKLGRYLVDHIEEWQKASQVYYATQKNERMKLKEMLQIKRKKQEEYHRKMSVFFATLPFALKNAQDKLKEEFHDQAKANGYIDNIMQSLKSNAQ